MLIVQIRGIIETRIKANKAASCFIYCLDWHQINLLNYFWN